MSGWWKALREYWEENKEFELGVLPLMWPVPALILAILSWDIATRETAPPWQLWAIVISQVALLLWLFWLWRSRPRD